MSRRRPRSTRPSGFDLQTRWRQKLIMSTKRNPTKRKNWCLAIADSWQSHICNWKQKGYLEIQINVKLSKFQLKARNSCDSVKSKNLPQFLLSIRCFCWADYQLTDTSHFWLAEKFRESSKLFTSPWFLTRNVNRKIQKLETFNFDTLYDLLPRI